MKKLLLSLAAVGALAATAAPAAAQDWRGRGDGRDSLQWRIERAEQRGAISSREAWGLRARLRDIDRLERRYGRDGRIDGWERDDLHRRYAMIGDQLRYAMRDGDSRYGYGYGDRDRDGYRDQDDRYDWRR